MREVLASKGEGSHGEREVSIVRLISPSHSKTKKKTEMCHLKFKNTNQKATPFPDISQFPGTGPASSLLVLVQHPATWSGPDPAPVLVPVTKHPPL